MKARLRSLTKRIAQIGSDPTDSEELRLQKSLLVLATFPFSAAGITWGLSYIAVGAWLPGLNPLIYGVALLVLLVIFSITKNYPFFRFMQLLFMLILPFVLMFSLGGFVSGSAAIIWSLLSPMGALLLDKPRRSLYWFAGFVVLVLVSAVYEPYHDPSISRVNEVVRGAFFLLNIGVVGSLVFLMVFYFVIQRNRFQARSEELLLNILPSSIVEILKEKPRTIADAYDNVSVLFADVVDFTGLSARLTPTQLVDMLNQVFLFFDELVDRYGLEKIKTIGDCYMVASGVPTPREDHAHALVQLALDVQKHVEANTFMGHRLAFRIGINSGAVVAGVIGSKKFSYDLWGDAANTASRMESHGREGRIQISRATYELVKDDFACSYLGEVDVKGKGLMDVWAVEGS